MKPVYISRKLYRFSQPLVEKLNMYYNADSNFWAGTWFISRPRYGSWSVWDMAPEPAAQGPALIVNDALTFESVTDQRSADLLAAQRREQCRVAVLWSGGIDSTVALAALIKNWGAADLAQVDVVMNANSYYENPVFYDQAIKKNNIRTISINDLYQNPCRNHIITDGEPADKLWLVKIALNYARAHGGESLRENWILAQHKLVAFFRGKFQTQQQCEQYFELIADNIRTTGAPVENVGDWFWWINYNWHWAGHLWYNYIMLPTKGPAELDLYRRRYHAWFNSHAYQQWSFGAEGRESKHFDSIKYYKWPAKTYINSVVDNPYYMEFKTKNASTTRYNGIDIYNTNPVAVFNDGSVMNSTDPEQIQQFIDSYLLI